MKSITVYELLHILHGKRQDAVIHVAGSDEFELIEKDGVLYFGQPVEVIARPMDPQQLSVLSEVEVVEGEEFDPFHPFLGGQ